MVSEEPPLPACNSSDAVACRVTIPELLSTILSYSPRPDYPRLMLVSRAFFAHIAPILWANPECIEDIFTLIPGIVIDKDWRHEESDQASYSTGHSPFTNINIPYGADFTRFDVYAGFVKRLHITGTLKFVNVDVLKAYRAERESALLPSLGQLMLYYCASLPTLASIGDWLDCLLGPSVSGVHVCPRLPQDDSEFALEIQRIVLQRCPNVQRMHIGIQSHLDPTHSRSFLHRSLSLLPQLRTFSGHGSILEPQNLEILSMLPYLETLRVNTSYDTRTINVAKTRWPSSPFPSMRSVYLCDMVCEEIDSLFGISTLANYLVSVEIKMNKSNGRIPPELSEWSKKFIRNLTVCSRQINKLILFFGPRETVIQLSTVELRSLEQLPLVHVDFFGLGFESTITTLDIALAIPDVQTLHLKSTEVEIRDLQPYATLLGSLKSLAFSKLHPGAEFSVSNAPASPVGRTVTLEFSFDLPTTFAVRPPRAPLLKNGEVSLYASGLGKLWRNIRCVAQLKKEAWSRSIAFDQLNSAILEHQGGTVLNP